MAHATAALLLHARQSAHVSLVTRRRGRRGRGRDALLLLVRLEWVRYHKKECQLIMQGMMISIVFELNVGTASAEGEMSAELRSNHWRSGSSEANNPRCRAFA